METLNNVKLAENDNEYTESLFVPGETCKGYIRRTSQGADILNHKKEKVGVINKAGVLAKASKMKNRYWYTYENPDIIGEFSGPLERERQCRAILEK